MAVSVNPFNFQLPNQAIPIAQYYGILKGLQQRDRALDQEDEQTRIIQEYRNALIAQEEAKRQEEIATKQAALDRQNALRQQIPQIFEPTQRTIGGGPMRPEFGGYGATQNALIPPTRETAYRRAAQFVGQPEFKDIENIINNAYPAMEYDREGGQLLPKRPGGSAWEIPGYQADPYQGLGSDYATFLRATGLPNNAESYQKWVMQDRDTKKAGASSVSVGIASPVEKGTKAKIEDQMIESLGLHSLVREGLRTFRPEYQNLGAKFGQSWASLKDKTVGLSEKDRSDLNSYTEYRAAVGQLTAEKLKTMSGAAVTPQEYARNAIYLPIVGESPWQGDSPTVLKNKLTRMDDFFTKVNARLAYVRANGLTIEQVPLDNMPKIMRERGNALVSEIKRANPRATDDQIKEAVSSALVQEFGVSP